MSQENLEIVKETVAALNSRDFDAALTHFAPDAGFRELASELHPPRLTTGTERIREVWALWAELFDELHVDVEEAFEAGDAVICSSHWTGHGKVSGQPLDVRDFDLYELRDGLIIRAILGYGSKAEALEAVGLSE